MTRAASDRFAAYVAHELRTPLATQRALLELALGDRDTDVAAWREIGEDVLRACRQQERLLEACLALARSPRRLERCEPVDLAAVAAEMLEAHDLTGLESIVALESARTVGDRDLLECLTANLISNAIRHNIAGGRIEVATLAESGRAVLSVTNTGPLVPTAELERLFQPFQRLSSTPMSYSDGIGLGLAIVDAIADAHGARVSARAGAGGGLEIEVGFPAIPARGRLLTVRTVAVAVAVAAVGVALLGAGCGGSGSTSSQATPISQALAFSHCMRSEGVPSFPDPDPRGVWPKTQIELVAGNARFEAATQACGNLLPDGGPGVPPSPAVVQLIQTDMLKFARCMRSHGVANWPDPSLDRGRAIFDPEAVGIDPSSPRISTRMQECERVFPASLGIPPGA